MKQLSLVFLFLPLVLAGNAQSKIFKEVGEEISTVMKPILQDNNLVGYLAFTRLERVSADSFNYRVTIMDENLNDIGKVNFRESALDLQTVSFEQNTLCLGYIQSTLNNVETVQSRKGYRRAQDAANDSHILLQFVSLEGHILNSWAKEVNLNMASVANNTLFSSAMKLVSFLKYGMQIRNIPNFGFAVFYGDEMKQQLLSFDTKGTLTQQLDVPAIGRRFYLRTSASNVYLMAKMDTRVPEGGFRLYVYSARGLTPETNFDLRDGYDNWLKVLSFDNDPATGDPFIAGCIINPARDNQFLTAYDYSFTPYLGLFTLDLGNAHKEMHANCSYWSGDTIPGIDADGLFAGKEFYVHYTTAFRDYHGNTMFTGTALVGKGFVGAARYRLTDGVFVRQEANGNITLDNNVPCDSTKTFGSSAFLPDMDKKDYYKVVAADSKSNYMIIDDEVKIYIYNVDAKKVVRTIPHKDGNVKINVYPAKEGYMMVAEYNRREKFTRFSIEAL